MIWKQLQETTWRKGKESLLRFFFVRSMLFGAFCVNLCLYLYSSSFHLPFFKITWYIYIPDSLIIRSCHSFIDTKFLPSIGFQWSWSGHIANKNLRWYSLTGWFYTHSYLLSILEPGILHGIISDKSNDGEFWCVENI